LDAGETARILSPCWAATSVESFERPRGREAARGLIDHAIGEAT